MNRHEFNPKKWEPITSHEINPPKQEIPEKDSITSHEAESKRRLDLYREDLADVYELPKELSQIILDKIDIEEKIQTLKQEVTDERRGDNNEKYLEQIKGELEDFDMQLDTLNRKLERLLASKKELDAKYDEYLKKHEINKDSYNPTDSRWN